MAGKVGNVPKEKDSLSKNVDANSRDRNQSKEMELKEESLWMLKSGTKWECDVCFIVFTQSHSLKRHLRRFGDLKYPCNECGTKFRTSEHLQSHVMHAHNAVATKRCKLKCPICHEKAQLEMHLRSHLCHYHNGWEDMDIFSSESCLNESQTLAAIESQLGGQTPETKELRKQRTIRLVKEVVRKASEDWKAIWPNGKSKKSETPTRTVKKSESPTLTVKKLETPIKHENVKPVYQRHSMSKELKALLNDVVVSKCEAKRKLSSSFQDRQVLGNRHKRPALHNRQSRSSNARKSVRKLSKDASDASLRALHSCKDCYVPLRRINTTKVALTDLMKREKERAKNLLNVSSRRAGKSESRCESKEPVDQSQSRSLQEPKTNLQVKLLNVQEDLEKFLSSGVFVKTEIDHSEDYVSSNVFTETPEECFDPLGSPRRSNGDDRGINESKEIGEFAHYPLSLEYPFKMEIENSEAAENLQMVAESFPQCQDSSSPPVKAEPMDCEIGGHSARPETSAESPEVTNPSVKTDTVNCDRNSEFVEQAEASRTRQDEIESPAIGEYVSCGMQIAAEYPMATETSEPQIPQEDFYKTLVPQVSYGTNALPEPSGRPTQGLRIRTMISSRICNKVFSTRRTMLRHCREKHLTCLNDTVYCTCGKEMVGRRAVERHFSLHCDTVITTYAAPSKFASPCTPLEKTYTCEKCGERFWLETCMNDHPPNCEQVPKVIMTKQFRLTKQNLHRTFGVEEHLEENGEYICRICDVRFMTVENLVRHVRTYSSGERFPCPICLTVFSQSRLLKSHIRSTHDNNCTAAYNCFCDFCNQGFTKKVYKQVHTMHVHSSSAWETTEASNENYRLETPAIIGSPENRCEVCNLVFSSRKRYADHVSYYDRNERFRCNICGETFEGQYSAHHHGKKVHYRGNARNSYPHYCAICGEGFTYKTHLHAHTLHVHDGEFGSVTLLRNGEAPENNCGSTTGAFSCEQCAKGFLTDADLLTHLETHKSEEIMTRVKCSRCEAEFATWSSWKLHFENSHGGETSDQPESGSSNVFTFPLNSAHDGEVAASSADSNIATPQMSETNQSRTPEPVAIMTTTSDNLSRSERCNICGMDCPGQYGLAKHRAMYYNTGAYICEFCGRRFNWQNFYRDHKLKHFRRDVHNNCFCPVCDEGFENVECLEMHTIHLHQQSLRDLRDRSAQESPRRLLESRTSAQSGRCSESRFAGDDAAYSNLCAEITECYNRKPGYEAAEQLNANARARDENYTLEVYPNGQSGHFSVAMKGMERHDLTDNRFYILADNNVHPQTVDSLGECDKNVGLKSSLFRYDNTLTCAKCNITFTSKEMLNTHYVILHMISRDFEFMKEKSQKQHAPVDVDTVSQNEQPQEDNSSDVQLLPTPSISSRAEEDTPDKSVTERTSAGNISGTSESMLENQFDRYRCTACDIIFADKKLFKIHDESVHGLKMTGDGSALDPESGRLSTKKSVACSTQPTPTVEPEEIWISDDEAEDNNRLTPTARNPDEPNVKKKAKTSQVRLVNLPPGNYKISKLKIRSTDTVAGKLKNLKSAETR